MKEDVGKGKKEGERWKDEDYYVRLSENENLRGWSREARGGKGGE